MDYEIITWHGKKTILADQYQVLYGRNSTIRPGSDGTTNSDFPSCTNMRPVRKGNFVGS